jgi:acetyl esterase/lipase
VSNKTTATFKTVDRCAIQADVYTLAGSRPRPVIVWIHGGALILGDRTWINPAQLQRYLDAGFAVVSIDYRLAPETKLPAIADDLVDAVRWVREEAPHQFPIDPTRLAVIGHSAGGYLTLLAGCRVTPSPQALVAFYGYGDIAGEWYTAPSPFYCKQPMVSGAEAYAAVGTTTIAGSPPGGSNRGRFYLYCRQRGLWPREVTGHDPTTEPGVLAPYCPLHNVTAAYPTTLLLHGDDDTDVPYEQSVLMAAALARAGVEHQLLTIPGGEHGFDGRLDDPVVAAAFAQVLTFLERHVLTGGQ